MSTLRKSTAAADHKDGDAASSVAPRPGAAKIHLLDLHPPREDLRAEALEGLQARPKTLPCKLLYDRAGSVLFDRICTVDEYYPTRTELGIMREHMDEIVDAVGPGAMIIEFGSGTSEKIVELLGHLREPAGYVPLEISRQHLLDAAHELSDRFPDLELYPICADFHQQITLPPPVAHAKRKVMYFPGSTIGNFTRGEAQLFLARFAEIVGPGGGLLVGVDLVKDRDVLRAAYDDSEGVTAAFNLNLLERLNRDLGSDFDVSAFEHRAIFNEEHRRIEMRLVAQRDMTVRLGGEAIEFKAGESICTEHSHKYTIDGFAEMAAHAGFSLSRRWTDENEWFAVLFFEMK